MLRSNPDSNDLTTEEAISIAVCIVFFVGSIALWVLFGFPT